MIDGLKLRTKDKTTIANILNANVLVYNGPGTKPGYEESIYKWRGLFFTFTKNQVEVRGSIARFLNDGKDNDYEFSYENLMFAILEFERILNVSCKNFTIHNIEVGFNIVSGHKSGFLLKRLIAFLGAELRLPEPPVRGKSKSHNYGVTFYFDQFEFKVYDITFSPNGETLRLELRITTMQKIKHIPLKTLDELLNPDILNALSVTFFNHFNYLLIKEDINPIRLSASEKRLITESHNGKSWEDLSPKNRYRRKNKLQMLLASGGESNHKSELSNLLKTQWEDYCRGMKKWVLNNQGDKQKNGHQITEEQTSQVDIKLPLDNRLIDTLCNTMNITDKSESLLVSKIKRCKGCGGDISKQTSRSAYCVPGRKCRDDAHNRNKKKENELSKSFMLFEFEAITQKRGHED